MFSEMFDARERHDVLAFLYAASGITSFASGVASLMASAQATGRIASTGVSIGRLVIFSRFGWAAVAGWVGWIAIALAVVSFYLVPDELEKWLSSCVYGKSESHYDGLQEALDAYQDLVK